MRDAILVSFSNCVTSFFAGLVVFSYMGYLSHITGQNIDNIVQAGNIKSKTFFKKTFSFTFEKLRPRISLCCLPVCSYHFKWLTILGYSVFCNDVGFGLRHDDGFS